MKVAILSHSLSPSISGQAIILGRLLNVFDPNEYCLISNSPRRLLKGNRRGYSLPGEILYLQSAVDTRFLNLPFIRSFVPMFYSLSLRRYVDQLSWILNKESCSSLLACSGHPLNIPAALIVGNRMNLPVYIYIFDDYQYQWPNRLGRRFARMVEETYLKYARTIIVTNTELEKIYSSRTNVPKVVIHNAVDIVDLQKNKRLSLNSIDIVFTGSIYHAHYDAIDSFAEAIEKMDKPHVRLHIYTPQLERDIQIKFTKNVVFHGNVSNKDARNKQLNADFLYMPLAFHSKIQEVVRSASPGKMGEYLGSGRPIIVHAPSDTFISKYFKANKCGHVINSTKIEDISNSIRSLLDNPELIKVYEQSARKKAEEDFNMQVISKKFRQLIKNHSRSDNST